LVVVLAYVVSRTLEGEGVLVRRLFDLPVVGEAIRWLVGGVASLYVPPFLVIGSPDPALAAIGLYLVSAAVLAYRRQYVAAPAAFVLPIALGWWFAWQFMQS
jgi:hypothetical protein